MKLSEIKGERTLKVIADLLEPIGNIVNDKKALESLQNAEKVPIITILPELIRTHEDDVYNMLAILDGVSIEEYKENTSMVKIIKDFTDIVKDEDIRELFTSAKATEVEK